MANWKNAPLVYTIGMVQFPHVPTIERFTNAFLDKVRGTYPLFDMVSVPLFNANIGPQGLQITQQESKMWQFLSVDKNWGFVLTEQSLSLHTTKYHDFSDFAERFKVGLNALLALPDIGISWITSLGIRYVDLIQPSDHKLNEYLESWILPTEPPQSQMSIIGGAYISRYKTEIGELRLQLMRNPPFTLPPELQNPLIVNNNWAKERPSVDFALVDTDHGITYEEPKSVNVEEILGSLDSLHILSKQVFESIGTPIAIKSWRGE